METQDLDTCAPFLKALSDTTRWRIVGELLDSQLNVNDLADRLRVSQYNVSKHLRILREAGIIETRRFGKHVSCGIVPEFRRRISKDRSQLELGCCLFRFERYDA